MATGSGVVATEAAALIQRMLRCILPMLLAALVVGGIGGAVSQPLGTGPASAPAALGPSINGSAQEFGGAQVRVMGFAFTCPVVTYTLGPMLEHNAPHCTHGSSLSESANLARQGTSRALIFLC